MDVFTDPLLAKIDEVLAMRMAMPGGGNDDEALRLEESFIDFIEAAWPSIDPSEFQPNWAVDGLAEHLQAVANGQIKRLLVNFPPRCSKTLVTPVCWPSVFGPNASVPISRAPRSNSSVVATAIPCRC